MPICLPLPHDGHGDSAAKRWISVDTESCPECGTDDVEVLTDAEQYGDGWYAVDGDVVRCRECDTRGAFSCDGESESWVNWGQE